MPYKWALLYIILHCVCLFMVHTLQLYSHCISIAPGLVLQYKWALLYIVLHCICLFMVHTLQLYFHCISIAPGLVLPYNWALLTLLYNCTLYLSLYGTLQLYSPSPGISHVLQYMWGLLSIAKDRMSVTQPADKTFTECYISAG